jgi:putative SbcD/Mre11-related phosphoesterase
MSQASAVAKGAVRCQEDWLLTAARAAVHLPTATVVVADLHLGYAEARRAGGEAVPLVPLERRLAPLASVAAGARARRLVIAGDLFEDGVRDAAAAELLAWAERMELELAVVPGNHDRGSGERPSGLPLFPDGVCVGGWQVVHGHAELPAGRVVQGHLHPCLRRGRLSAPCYLVADGHIVLPAYSADARGVNVLRLPAWKRYRCYAAAGGEVLDFGELARLPRRMPP